jgi:hypothetical protein
MYIDHRLERRRPPLVRVLSKYTAVPSWIHRGCTWFGARVLPITRFTRAGSPVMLSRWRTCVYSCVMSASSQSSTSPSGDRSSGVVTLRRTAL